MAMVEWTKEMDDRLWEASNDLGVVEELAYIMEHFAEEAENIRINFKEVAEESPVLMRFKNGFYMGAFGRAIVALVSEAEIKLADIQQSLLK